MKKFYYLLLLIIPLGIALLFIQSCNKDNRVLSNKIGIKNLVTPLDAGKIARNINKSNIVLGTINKSLLKSEKYRNRRKVRDSVIFSNKKKIPYLYVYNFADGGFTIISGDNRLMPVLAYADKGTFKKDSLPGGLVRWLAATVNTIQNLRASDATQPVAVAQVYSALECPVEPLKSTGAECKPQITYSHTVGPLLVTTWGQGCGYNADCPPSTDGAYCYHDVTGCVATAMAQVMYYWKYPATFDWSQMAVDYGTPETAKLMDSIGKAVGMNWGAAESGAWGKHISPALKGKFQYGSASFSSYKENSSYQTVMSNLDAGEPVLLEGYSTKLTNFLGFTTGYADGHEWVCDGYMDTQYTTYEVIDFHMNWGWGSSAYTTWVAYNYWYVSTPTQSYNFQYADSLVYNIHP